MKYSKSIKVVITVIVIITMLSFVISEKPDIPKLWDMEKLKSAHLPLIDTSIHVEPISEELYNQIPERVAYKTYPLYLPGSEPKGYYEWLANQDPEIIFDASKMKTEADWIKAGEIIYDMPQGYSTIVDSSKNFEIISFITKGMQEAHELATPDGIFPFVRLVVRKKGIIEIGDQSCASCHNKLMPDGSILKGGQGNSSFDKNFGLGLRAQALQRKMSDSAANQMVQRQFWFLFGAPWIKHESQSIIQAASLNPSVNVLTATVPGVMHRHGSAFGNPTAIPDLFNLKERKYLDRTGLILQRDIGDVMRYAVLNQNLDFLNSYGGFKPDGSPDNIIIQRYTRFSDAQAYALAKYLYSLKPLPNPVKASPELIAKGKQIFEEETCIGCHTPPFYSSNKLSLAKGFTPTANALLKYDVLEFSVGTDPGLALYSRRGTGYYKVPSLAGVWNRSALMHSGYVTSLEEMFNPARQKDDFMPSGFNPNVDKPFAVKGHSFGLGLNDEDRKALIAFLRSL